MSIQYGILDLRRLVCDNCGVGRVFGPHSTIKAEEAKASLRGWTHDSSDLPARNWCSDCTPASGVVL